MTREGAGTRMASRAKGKRGRRAPAIARSKRRKRRRRGEGSESTIYSEMTIGGYSQRVGGADDLAAGLDDLLALPDHAHDGAGAHVVDEVAEEGLGGEVGVVLLGVRLLHRHHLHAAEEETLGLEALDDLADETALDAVGLDHDVGLLHSCCGW